MEEEGSIDETSGDAETSVFKEGTLQEKDVKSKVRTVLKRGRKVKVGFTDPNHSGREEKGTED